MSSKNNNDVTTGTQCYEPQADQLEPIDQNKNGKHIELYQTGKVRKRIGLYPKDNAKRNRLELHQPDDNLTRKHIGILKSQSMHIIQRNRVRPKQNEIEPYHDKGRKKTSSLQKSNRERHYAALAKLKHLHTKYSTKYDYDWIDNKNFFFFFNIQS